MAKVLTPAELDVLLSQADSTVSDATERKQAGVVTYYVNEEGQWTVFQNLAEELDTADNHEAEELIRAAIEKEDPALLGQLDFDSESSMFCVLAPAEADIVKLAEIVGRLRQGLKRPTKRRGRRS